MILKHTSFIVTGAILIVAVAAVAPYGVNVGNTQGTNMMKNMSKTIKMIAPGGNTSNTINMTAREWNLGKTIKIIH